MTWKSTLVVSGAGLVATWLGVVSTPVVPGAGGAAASAQPAQAVTPAAAANDIQLQAARLQAGIRRDAEYRSPSRNLFRFAEHRAAPARAAQAVQPFQAPDVPSPAVRPRVRLSGIAADTVDGAVQRTAVLSTSADVLLLKEGESGGGYTVRKIGDDSVELVDTAGSELTLSLSNP